MILLTNLTTKVIAFYEIIYWGRERKNSIQEGHTFNFFNLGNIMFLPGMYSVQLFVT